MFRKKRILLTRPKVKQHSSSHLLAIVLRSSIFPSRRVSGDTPSKSKSPVRRKWLKICANNVALLSAGLIILLTSLLFVPNSFGDEQSRWKLFDQKLMDHPERPRGVVLGPLASFVLPGFDQWVEGQYATASFFSGIALGGFGLAANAAKGIDRDDSKIDARDNEVRQYSLGSQIYQAMGGLSLYHSFRSAVTTRKPQGQYAFLKHEETVGEILLAPFRFEYLTRPTTWIPLAVLLGVSISAVRSARSERSKEPLVPYTGSDAFYATAFSYNAGTHEEAMFRGYLMPLFQENVFNEFWSNTATAFVFALAHLPSNPFPLPQFALGWYLGHITQKDEWRISESVFIHAWWDVIAFNLAYIIQPKSDLEERVLRLPELRISF